MLRHSFFEHSHHTHLGALYYATAAAWPDRGLDAFHGLCDPWRWPCSHNWRRLRLCRPYTRQDRADPSRLLPSTGLVAAAGMRLLEAPLHRGSQQLPLLSCFRRCTEPPSSSSLAPHRAAAHLFAGRLKDPIASSTAHAHERAERRSNASGPSVCMNYRPRARWSDRICACQRSPARARTCANRGCPKGRISGL